MAATSRMRAALDRLEARRTEIEAQIIADMERKFFSDAPAVLPHALDGSNENDQTTTECGSPSTFDID